MSPAISLFFLLCARVLNMAAESGAPANTEDDFSPMCFVLLLVCLCIVLVLVGAGMVFAAVALVLGAGLVAFGAVSSSVLIGLVRRRFSSGFRALHYQVFAIASWPLGVLALWLVFRIFHIFLTHGEIFAIGSIAGICGGLLLAFVFDRLLVIACRRVAVLAAPDFIKNA